jgi:hypothetical protein
VLKALDCRNVIQVIQDWKYIKYNNGLNATVTVEEKELAPLMDMAPTTLGC